MNTIIGKSYVSIRDEKIANATITPGMLVERMSTDKVRAHARAGGAVNPLFALEDENQGKGITDNYASGDIVKLWRPVPGEQVYALLDDNSTQNIAIGDFVESDGAGRVRRVDNELSSAGNAEFPSHIIGVALEAVDPGNQVPPRVLIEIM